MLASDRLVHSCWLAKRTPTGRADGVFLCMTVLLGGIAFGYSAATPLGSCELAAGVVRGAPTCNVTMCDGVRVVTRASGQAELMHPNHSRAAWPMRRVTMPQGRSPARGVSPAPPAIWRSARGATGNGPEFEKASGGEDAAHLPTRRTAQPHRRGALAGVVLGAGRGRRDSRARGATVATRASRAAPRGSAALFGRAGVSGVRAADARGRGACVGGSRARAPMCRVSGAVPGRSGARDLERQLRRSRRPHQTARARRRPGPLQEPAAQGAVRAAGTRDIRAAPRDLPGVPQRPRLLL